MKVWHPDRFGSDARLRLKAEEKLRQINEAYRVLQEGGGAVAGSRVGPAARASSSSASSSSSSSAAAASSSVAVVARARGRSRGVAWGWLYGGFAVLVLLLTVYLVVVRPGEMSGDAVPGAAANPPAVSATPSGASDGRVGRPASSNSGSKARGSDAEDSAGAGKFRVRSLSEAETEQLEEACEPQRDRFGQEAYHVCVAAQVAVITNRVGRPDLTALNAAERESIESACAEARRTGGVDGYDRCLTAKMAEWAAEPARPSLSGLNEADRSSVELACRGAKDAQGPAAYDRCLVRFMKALMDSR